MFRPGLLSDMKHAYLSSNIWPMYLSVLKDMKKRWPFVQVIISSLAPHLHPVMSEGSSPAMRSGKAGAAHLSSPSTLYAAAPACLLQ